LLSANETTDQARLGRRRRRVGTLMENCFPEPRAFQAAAHERLRDGVRNGHRCQILMAATGAGNTYLGLRIIHEALERGRRAIFVCDRTTLIDQTTAVADAYGLLAHGVNARGTEGC
jgi:superfamily II DNA or RNA helicase